MLAKSTSEKFATHAEIQFRTYNGKVGKRLKSECNTVLVKQELTPPTIHQKQTATTGLLLYLSTQKVCYGQYFMMV